MSAANSDNNSFYKPPAPGDKMRALYAIPYFPDLTKSEIRVANCLVLHANAKTGRCDPGQARIAFETKLSDASVKRSIKGLMKKGLVARRLRGERSSAYRIRWDVLAKEYALLESRVRQWRSLEPQTALSIENQETAGKLRRIETTLKSGTKLSRNELQDWALYLYEVWSRREHIDPLAQQAQRLLSEVEYVAAAKANTVS